MSEPQLGSGLIRRRGGGGEGGGGGVFFIFLCVSGRRDGRRQIYTVDDPHVITMVEQIFEHIAPDGTLAPDPPLPLRQMLEHSGEQRRTSED